MSKRLKRIEILIGDKNNPDNLILHIWIKAEIYGYLGLHQCLYEAVESPFDYSITHIKTGLKLPFYGTKKQLRKFCKEYGNKSNLWENPLEHTREIISAWNKMSSQFNQQGGMLKI